MYTQSRTNTSYTNGILNTLFYNLFSFKEEKVVQEEEDQAPEASGQEEEEVSVILETKVGQVGQSKHICVSTI